MDSDSANREIWVKVIHVNSTPLSIDFHGKAASVEIIRRMSRTIESGSGKCPFLLPSYSYVLHNSH